MSISLDNIYSELKKINQVDLVTSAIYREHIQDILATPTIALETRKAIADKLNQANQQLAMKNVEDEDSY